MLKTASCNLCLLLNLQFSQGDRKMLPAESKITFTGPTQTLHRALKFPVKLWNWCMVPTWLGGGHLVCELSGCDWGASSMFKVNSLCSDCNFKSPIITVVSSNETTMMMVFPLCDNHELHPWWNRYLKEIIGYSRLLSKHAEEAGSDGQDLHKKELSSLKGAEMVRRQQGGKVKGLSEPPAHQLCPCFLEWGQSGKRTDSLGPLSTSSFMVIFHQPKCASYFCPAQVMFAIPNQTLLPLLYLLPAECSGCSCGLPGEWVNRIISSAPPHNCSGGMSHQEQAGISAVCAWLQCLCSTKANTGISVPELLQGTLQEKHICLILRGLCAWKVHTDISTDFGNICWCAWIYINQVWWPILHIAVLYKAFS